MFSFDTKTAEGCSLVIILFSQFSKLTTTALTTGFGIFDLSVAPAMALGAVLGGLIGASLNKILSEKNVNKKFQDFQKNRKS